MTGQDLYIYWTAANLEEDCDVDTWAELEDADRAAWNRTAELASFALKPGERHGS